MEWLNSFDKIGYWELNDKYSSHKVLKHENLRGINFVIDKEKAQLENVVYVFKTKSEIIYIGETTKNVKSRFSSYRYGFDKLKDTDNRVKIAITKYLEKDEIVEIFLIQPKTNFMFNNQQIELSISKSLEDYLISTYKPKINTKENKSLSNKMNYQQKVDEIFGKGSLWKHRTLRTLFDPYSSEYGHTSVDKKIEIVRTMLDNNLNLNQIVQEYKQFYIEENKLDVAKDAEEGLKLLLEIMQNSESDS